MTLRSLFTIVLGMIYGLSICQDASSYNVFISFGISKIPLYIKRTEKFRIMTYPAAEVGIRINNRLYGRASYLYHDVKVYRGEQRSMFIEASNLTSYEVVEMQVGKKFTLSQFSDYVFAGVKYLYLEKKTLNLLFGCDVGFRFGETSVIASVSQNPSWPKGFEIHSDSQNSTSPGLRLNVSPQLKLFETFYLEPTFGSYIFTNWPVIQFFGSLQLGFYF